MDRPARPGHVSRARLLGEGSALASQLARAQEEQQQQQQQLSAEQVTTAGHEDEDEPAKLTWNELWDARITSGHVGLAMRDEETRLQQLQLWWPLQLAEQKRGGRRGTQHAHILQYSAAAARALQRQQAPTAPAVAAAAPHKRPGTAEADGQAATARLHHSLTDALFGPPASKRRHVGQPAAAPSAGATAAGGDGAAAEAAEGAAAGTGGGADWLCCNRVLPSDAGARQPSSGPVPCGTSNPAAQPRCCVCGAARWDGAAGQLRLRLLAALQTSDLDSTSIKQIVARITAEAGSNPEAGLLLPPEAIQAELRSFLAARDASRAAAADPQQAGMAAAGACAAAPAATGDDLQLHGCPAAAHVVYAKLLPWLEDKRQQQAGQSQQQQQQQQGAGQQQQRQQQQQQFMTGPEAAGRVHAAALAAAALAPGLMTGVFRRQSCLPEQKPIPGAITSWIEELFEQQDTSAAPAAAAAAAAASAGNPAGPTAAQQQAPGTSNSRSHVPHTSSAPGPASPDSSVPVLLRLQPLSRPLPWWTLSQLLDRRGAALRQELSDYIMAVAPHLPAVMRRYCLPDDEQDDGDIIGGVDDELMSEVVPVREWLWQQWSSNRSTRRVLPAGEGGCGGSDDDVVVTESIECDDWAAVVAARRHIHHILAAWCNSSSTQQRQQQQGRPKRQRQHGYDTTQEMQLQSRLLQQLAHTQQCWGSPAPFALRNLLSGASSQQQQQQQGAGGGRSLRQGNAQQAAAASLDGPSAAAGARRRRQSQQAAAAAAAGPSAAAEPSARSQQQQQQTRGRRRGRVEGQEQQHAEHRDNQIAGHKQQGQSQQEQKQEQRPAKRAKRTAVDGAGSSPGQRGTSSGSSTSSSSSSSSSDSSSSDSSSGSDAARSGSESEWVASEDDEGREVERSSSQEVPLRSGTASPTLAHGQAEPYDECEAAFNLFLEGVDDLMTRSQVDVAHALAARPGSPWTAVHGQQGGQRVPGGREQVVAGAGVSGLPAGMQVVLQQAAAMGISARVLQRTVGRLAALLPQHGKQGSYVARLI